MKLYYNILLWYYHDMILMICFFSYNIIYYIILLWYYITTILYCYDIILLWYYDLSQTIIMGDINFYLLDNVPCLNIGKLLIYFMLSAYLTLLISLHRSRYWVTYYDMISYYYDIIMILYYYTSVYS